MSPVRPSAPEAAALDERRIADLFAAALVERA